MIKGKYIDKKYIKNTGINQITQILVANKI